MAWSFPVSELLEHASFLKCLARDLVGDAHAEDAVQEALIAALEKPPSEPRSFGLGLRESYRTGRATGGGKRAAEVSAKSALPDLSCMTRAIPRSRGSKPSAF